MKSSAGWKKNSEEMEGERKGDAQPRSGRVFANVAQRFIEVGQTMTERLKVLRCQVPNDYDLGTRVIFRRWRLDLIVG